MLAGNYVALVVALDHAGEPIGVREFQGVLEQIIREIEIRCDPRDIPDVINVDVSNLNVHDVLHVSDIPVGANIEILNAPDNVIATVGIVKEEEVVAPVVEGEEPTEPEVIGKGKKEDEGAEEPGKKEPGKKEPGGKKE